ncbi:MAG: alkaline phosphatase family protein, partial [Actinomycetota bacterium]|nr:alkaline phosphatase family protein [Actinomycetota bacterium]
DNEPLVGAMARSSYHLGMLGHGAYSPGGDRDVAVVDQTAGLDFRSNDRHYRLPPYLGAGDAIERAVQVVDRRDGSTDGVWLGNEIAADDPLVRTTPAWPIYQTEQLIEIIDKEGFGADATPDLFYVNYKTTDLAGHRWNLVEPEERDVLREQDRQLPVLLDALDRLVGKGRYVVVLTADHGISPYPSTTGGWPIAGAEVVKDIQDAFADNPDDPELVRQNRGYQLFLAPQAQQSLDVQASDISRFLRNYRIRDNASSVLPPAFERRGDERVFMTALTPTELKEALRCAKHS